MNHRLKRVMAPFRRLYRWLLSWADGPYGAYALALLAFAEASFFPIPPDALLIALCLGSRHRSYYFALVCTFFSVVGGVFGYFIGQFAFELLALPVLVAYGKEPAFHELAKVFQESGGPAVFISALTPVPYKLVTISAGASAVSLPLFIGASVIGRGLRFFLVAGLIRWKGQVIAHFIERWFEAISVSVALLVVVAFFALTSVH